MPPVFFVAAYQLPTHASHRPCHHDHHVTDGNMTSDGTNSFKYDAENRLIEIENQGTGWLYTR